MMGLFSKFSAIRTGHRRTQSALDQGEVLQHNPEVTGVDATPSGVSHGIEVAVEFKPVEHPTEPLDNDKPVQCPLQEPSILNDGRIWKEWVSAENVRRRSDLQHVKEEAAGDSAGTLSQPTQFNRSIVPSMSAPERNLLKFLDEFNTSGT